MVHLKSKGVNWVENIPNYMAVLYKVTREQLGWQLVDSTWNTTQPVITCSKLTIETLEKGVKYVQS